MKNRDFSNIEEQIKDAVQGAIDSMDFGKLNQEISGTVGKAFDEVKKQFNYTEKPPEPARKPEPAQKPKAYDKAKAYKKPKPYVEPGTKAEQSSGINDFPTKIKSKGRVAAILYTVFGSIGAVITGIVLMVTGAAMFAWGSLGPFQITVLTLLFALLAIFCTMCGYGEVLGSRLKRLKRYMKIIDGKSYFSIKELAGYSGKSEKYIRKDLQKMIQLGLMPEGHLDPQGTCLMLDDQTYGQYLQTQKAMEQRLRAEKDEKAVKTAKAAQTSGTSKVDSGNPELDAMMEEGRIYIRKLREVNDAIPGEVISAKLTRLETITGKIFDTVKKRPQQMSQMQKFMDYYLPTTLKLVTAYQEFDGVDVQGENITSAKGEIEKTLDTINLAFEKLLDDLYQDTVFDVTTDASVLQTMLAKEGLTESDFKEERKP